MVTVASCEPGNARVSEAPAVVPALAGRRRREETLASLYVLPLRKADAPQLFAEGLRHMGMRSVSCSSSADHRERWRLAEGGLGGIPPSRNRRRARGALATETDYPPASEA